MIPLACSRGCLVGFGVRVILKPKREPLSESVEEHRGKNKENTKKKTRHLIQFTLACSAWVQHADHAKYFCLRLPKNAYVSTEFLFISNIFMRCTLTSGSGAESCMIHTTSER